MVLKKGNYCPLFDDGLAIHCQGGMVTSCSVAPQRKQREKGLQCSVSDLNGTLKNLCQKKKLKLKLVSTEGEDSGRRHGPAVLCPKDIEISLALNSNS